MHTDLRHQLAAYASRLDRYCIWYCTPDGGLA